MADPIPQPISDSGKIFAPMRPDRNLWVRGLLVGRLGDGIMELHEMIGAHPAAQSSSDDVLIRCVQECYACAQICTSCADACLSEDMVEALRQCVRLNLDCADVCLTTGSTAMRRTGNNPEVIAQMLATCALACARCAEECEKHAEMHEHCRICAAACRRCEAACKEASVSIGATVQ